MRKNEKKIHRERDLYDFMLTNVLKEKHNVQIMLEMNASFQVVLIFGCYHYIITFFQ